ncbi:hypothetical protein T484DRAFT_1896081, partial [Baffinella frigidus]
MWTVSCEDSIHASGKVRVRWAAPAGSASARKDFVAMFKVGEESLRKYDGYKVIAKEGLQNGEVDFTAPSSPGTFIFRYLRADYSEAGISRPLLVRSALSVLLDEVKAQGMSGNTESVLEMFETVMLQLKANDDSFHHKALESWRTLQARRASLGLADHQNGISDAQGESAARGGSTDANGSERLEAVEALVPAQPSVGESGVMMRLSVRGSGYYAAGRDAQGDARFVRAGEVTLVEGETAGPRGQAGLHLLVLRLSDLGVVWSQTYDTHHDPGAAERLSDDLAQHALESKGVSASRVLVVVTSQYAWEGYFSSALLCERLPQVSAPVLSGGDGQHETALRGPRSHPRARSIGRCERRRGLRLGTRRGAERRGRALGLGAPRPPRPLRNQRFRRIQWLQRPRWDLCGELRIWGGGGGRGKGRWRGAWSDDVEGGDGACQGASSVAVSHQLWVAAELSEGSPAQRLRILEEGLPPLTRTYTAAGGVSEAARLDAGRCLCNLINDPALSLHPKVVALDELRGGSGNEVQRCLVLRLSALTRDQEAARKIVGGPAIRVLTAAVLPPGRRAGGGGERSEDEGGAEEELRADALVGLASLCCLPELRVELLRQDIIDAVIPALVGNPERALGAPPSPLGEPQRNALSIIRALARDAVAVCTIRLTITASLAPSASPPTASPSSFLSPRGNNAPINPPGGGQGGGKRLIDGEEFPAIVATGFWTSVLKGNLVALPPAALVPGTLVCGVGDVVVLTAPQTSREGLVAALRLCQQSRALAVIAHVSGAPAPFPMLQHLPRDYGDVTVCTLVVPMEEAQRLIAVADASPTQGRESKGAGWQCAINPGARSREVLVRRAVPLLRAMLRDWADAGGG